jgi:uncharacterized protein (TIGR03435 family)
MLSPLIVALAIGLALVDSAQARGQDQQEKSQPLNFDVASIRPASPGQHQILLQLTPDGLRSEGAPLYMLMWQALAVPNNRIQGAPEWTRSAYYNIEAKVDSQDLSLWQSLPRNEQWQTVLRLLEERFNLKFHHESKVTQAYTLVVPESGRTKLKDASSSDKDIQPKQAPPRFSRTEHGIELKLQETSVSDFAKVLADALGQTVTDGTGLNGKYDFNLDYSDTPERTEPMNAADAPSSADFWPSIFTAVQEQLGLKLVSRKIPTDMIIIDQIERPSTN